MIYILIVKVKIDHQIKIKLFPGEALTIFYCRRQTPSHHSSAPFQYSQLQNYCLFFSFNFKLFGEPCTHISQQYWVYWLSKCFSVCHYVMLVKLRITSLLFSQKSKNFPHLKAQRITCIRLVILLVTIINSMTNLSSLFLLIV